MFGGLIGILNLICNIWILVILFKKFPDAASLGGLDVSKLQQSKVSDPQLSEPEKTKMMPDLINNGTAPAAGLSESNNQGNNPASSQPIENKSSLVNNKSLSLFESSTLN